jgi:hypothetical protein
MPGTPGAEQSRSFPPPMCAPNSVSLMLKHISFFISLENEPTPTNQRVSQTTALFQYHHSCSNSTRIYGSIMLTNSISLLFILIVSSHTSRYFHDDYKLKAYRDAVPFVFPYMLTSWVFIKFGITGSEVLGIFWFWQRFQLQSNTLIRKHCAKQLAWQPRVLWYRWHFTIVAWQLQNMLVYHACVSPPPATTF